LEGDSQNTSCYSREANVKYQFVSCRTSLLSEIAKFAAVFFFPIVAIALLGGAVFLLVCGKQANDYSYTLLMGYALVAAVAGAYLMRLSLICYALESRKIAFNQFGFTTKIRKNHAYTWDEVGEVSIVAFAANAGRQRYQSQICISFQPLTSSQLRKLCRSYLYGAANLNEFVLIDFSQGLVDELQTYSGLTVFDYRQLQLR